MAPVLKTDEERIFNEISALFLSEKPNVLGTLGKGLFLELEGKLERKRGEIEG